jgi:osmotically inducible protein OsmC
MKAERTADVVWQGTLTKGQGSLNGHSGALNNLPVTWASRIERSDGRTSPEELIAAAHASCYAMALSVTLERNDTPAETLRVSATCTLDDASGAPKISRLQLDVTGTVPGLDAAGFERMTQQAEQLCPVSNLMRNNTEIVLNAHLS